jgi:hypothetical protein
VSQAPPSRAPTLSVQERIALGRCSACGACDAQLHPDDGWDRGLAGPPSRWARVLAERPERWPELAPAIAHLPNARAHAMETRCHAHVPFVALRAEAHGKRPRPGPKKKRRADPG